MDFTDFPVSLWTQNDEIVALTSWQIWEHACIMLLTLLIWHHRPPNFCRCINSTSLGVSGPEYFYPRLECPWIRSLWPTLQCFHCQLSATNTFGHIFHV